MEYDDMVEEIKKFAKVTLVELSSSTDKFLYLSGRQLRE